jgi:hypothetical protein
MPVQSVARSKQGLGSVPFLQTLLPAMLAVQYLPQMSYSVSQSDQVIRLLCEGTFNLILSPDNGTVLN